MRFAMKDLREIAKSHGIRHLLDYDREEDLIHAIQISKGESDCFSGVYFTAFCNDKHCKWFDDCVNGDG